MEKADKLFKNATSCFECYPDFFKSNPEQPDQLIQILAVEVQEQFLMIILAKIAKSCSEIQTTLFGLKKLITDKDDQLLKLYRIYIKRLQD